MSGRRPFFLSGDPQPETMQDPDDPQPETMQDPDDPQPETMQDPDDPQPETMQDPDDPQPETMQDPDDPQPETMQDPDDPQPETMQDPDDPAVKYAMHLLQKHCKTSRRRRRSRSFRSDPHEDRPSNVEPAGEAVVYSGFITVRLSEHLELEIADDEGTLGELARKLELEGLTQVLDRYGLSDLSSRLVNLTLNGSYDPLGAKGGGVGLRDIEAKAATSSLPPRHSLASYWRIDLRDYLTATEPEAGNLWLDGWRPGRTETIERIIAELNDLGEVSRAYRELAVSDPQRSSSDDIYSGIQEYLEEAPLGIGARWARKQADGSGAKIGFVDLEQGWIPDHEDLKKSSPTLIHGDNRHGVGSYRGNHGSAVMSIVVGDDNNVGVEGIAPKAEPVFKASHFDRATNSSNVAKAIGEAFACLKPGDVLLLEVQRSYLPTEVDDADFDAIRLAVASGIVVIEAAGNGEANLDRYIDEHGDRVLDRRRSTFRESGALMVGAARAARPHRRYSGPVGVGSNYGSRIDCFAFGDMTVSAGYGRLDFDAPSQREAAEQQSYTDSFGGTSAAAPIIAGAALVLQSMHTARCGHALSPWEIRALLSDPRTGTRQGRGVRGRIGVMPNLEKIMRHRLRLVPDLYLRDHVGDTGSVPARTRISTSPDIIAHTREIEDPQAQFGEGNGSADTYPGGGPCQPGQDCFIYLRMRNRGLTEASAPRARVFWSEVATLVTPDLWNEITPARSRASLASDIPSGDTLVVQGPIRWSGDSISEAARQRHLIADRRRSRHYCFVALLEDADEDLVLPPAQPPYFDWREYRRFLRKHNNVACRNVHQVAARSIPKAGLELPFLWTGTPDLARRFDFQILQRLPQGVRVELEVPAALAARLARRRFWNVQARRDRRGAKIALPSRPRIDIPRLRLVAGARFPCRLRLFGGGLSRGHEVTIRQFYKGQEVGRIVWRF